jgi:very-short-patch-repair endonuclease
MGSDPQSPARRSEVPRDEDAAREALLAVAGYEIIRFPNEAVISDLASVLATICAAAEAHPPLSGTPPFRLGAL